MNAGYPTLGGEAIPGDIDGLAEIVRRLAEARSDVTRVQERVAANGLEEWTGDAADRFRTTLGRLPAELGRAAGAFDEAAGALRRFSGDLATLQNNASHYAARLDELTEVASDTQGRHDVAEADVASARQRASQASDPASLKVAGDALQAALSGWRQLAHELDEQQAEIATLRKQAQENREHYDEAVRRCCASLREGRETVDSIAIPG
jgi:chromosome segregation ATPase